LLEDERIDLAKRFPKLAAHEHLTRIIQMLEEGVAAEAVSRWTYELSKEHGIAPGQKSPYSVSVPTMGWFVKWWKEASARHSPSEKPRETPNSIYKSEELLLTAFEKKQQAIKLLDDVVRKAQETLNSQDKVSVQTAMQAIALREQLNNQVETQIEFSVEVRTVLAQIVQIVNETCDVPTRLRIAERLEKLPAFKKQVKPVSETPALEIGAVDAEFRVEEAGS
jgi:hypothetical protein